MSALHPTLIGLGLLFFGQPATAVDSFHCPPFPPPDAGDEIIVVTPAEVGALPAIVSNASPHTTILLEDGVYSLTANLNFTSPNVTLRSVSGDADAVVIDGEYRTSAAEPVRIFADHITVADLTIRRAWYHPIHASGGNYTTLYNLKIRDGRQQFVKVNADTNGYADFGLAACLDLQLTSAGRTFVEQNPSSILCYTGGFDLHKTWGWTVRDSVFRDIYCTDGGLAEHAIHFFKSNREPIVERNLILDCARGIGFGLGQLGFERSFADDPFEGTEMEGRQDEVMNIGGSIRNNIIHADIGDYYDTGIGLESAWMPEVLHNTVYSEEGLFNSAIDVRFSGSVGVNLTNNLYHPMMTVRGGAPPPDEHNNVFATPELFVDPVSGDLHLFETAIAAIDQGVAAGVVDDIDGESRDAFPDVGADELAALNTAPVVVISSPLDGSSYDAEEVVAFSGSATDSEEGDLTANLSWGSNLDGGIGYGGAPSSALSAGPHVIVAELLDGQGLAGSDQVSVTVTSAECPLTDTITGESVLASNDHRAVMRIDVGPAVTVENGGDLILRAGEVVALGEGLRVLNGGTLQAGVFVDPCE